MDLFKLWLGLLSFMCCSWVHINYFLNCKVSRPPLYKKRKDRYFLLLCSYFALHICQEYQWHLSTIDITSPKPCLSRFFASKNAKALSLYSTSMFDASLSLSLFKKPSRKHGRFPRPQGSILDRCSIWTRVDTSWIRLGRIQFFLRTFWIMDTWWIRLDMVGHLVDTSGSKCKYTSR